jgi:hypothetical protein
MAKTWVLHTGPKGTGAEVVPLERAAKRSTPTEPIFARPPRRRAKAEPPRSHAPRRFKVLDVMTRRPLIEDATTKETVEALKDVHSVTDVNVYVWNDERDRWRLLTLPERRAMWDLSRE